MGLRNRGSVALAWLAVLAFAATGCGSDDQSSDKGSTASKPVSTSSGKDEATAKAAELQKTTGIDWPQPTESFDPGTGKVAIISCGNVGINCLQGAKDAVAAAKAMGWTPSPIFDGEFTPAKQAGFVQQAIQEKYDGIIIVSMDANSIKAAVDAASAAKIPIACAMCANEGFEGKVVDVTTGGVTDGEAVGTWIASQAEPGAKIVGFDDKTFPIVRVRLSNAIKRINEYCPDCEVEELDFPTSDLTKPGLPTFSAMLSSHPEGQVDFVMPPYDPMSIPAAKVAVQQGRNDFKLTGYDASPEYLTLIKSGTGTAAATAAVPYTYTVWGAMDQVARMKAGMDTWESDRLPAVLVTADNADEFGKFGFLNPPDFDYKAKLQELWGK